MDISPGCQFTCVQQMAGLRDVEENYEQSVRYIGKLPDHFKYDKVYTDKRLAKGGVLDATNKEI